MGREQGTLKESAAFRQLKRKKQALSAEECRAILKTELRGVLSVNGDCGYPYGMPMNHYYCEEDGRLYFHCGASGHRLDALRRDGKASFCVCDGGTRKEGEWALTFRSVIVFGHVVFVEDRETVLRISRLLSYKFTADEDYINREIEAAGKSTRMFALVPESVTGKLVNEA